MTRAAAIGDNRTAGFVEMKDVRTDAGFAKRLALRGLAAYCLLALAMLLAARALSAAEFSHATARPSIVIPVGPLGYGPPGELYFMMRYSQVSLDFVDADHLLFTFQKKELLRHSPDEQPDDDDQLIHAVVLHLPEGKVSASADWRMPDRRRYLWPLSPGSFLVRQRDTLFLTDASLKLQPYGRFPGRLVGLQVSPGGDLLVAQIEQPEKREGVPVAQAQAGSAPDSTASKPLTTDARPILMLVLRVKDHALVAKSRVRSPVNLPINQSGFFESLEGKPNQWVLSFTPLTDGSPAPSAKPFAQVTSTCQPTLTCVSRDTIVATRCTPSYEHLATFLTLQGKMLWEHKWQARRVWPTWAYSQNGSRVAQGMLVRPAGQTPLGMDDVSGQQVDVFDTASGALLLSAPATPIYDAGQNFALSADGRRFAILHDGAIEIYDLP